MSAVFPAASGRMQPSRFVFSGLVFFALIASFVVTPSPARAQTCSYYVPAATHTCPVGYPSITTNRCETLRVIDQELPLHPTAVTTNGLLGRQVLNPYQECNGSAQNPLVNDGNTGEDAYYEKALAIFALADLTGNQSRLPEANQVLRYALLNTTGGWPAANAAALNYDANGGGDNRPWNLIVRSTAMRVYWLYSEALEPDVKAEYDKRIGYMRCAVLQTGGSENQKNIWNSTHLLAHDSGLPQDAATCSSATASANATAIHNFLKDTSLPDFAENGSKEAGSPFYNGWSVVSHANLAEFLKPAGSYATLANRARVTVDYFLAQQAVFSRNVYWTSPAVRWVQDTNGPLNFPDEPTNWARTFFSGAGELSGLVEMVASNYAPLVAHQEQFGSTAVFEAQAAQGPWNHHAHHTNTYAFGVQNTLDSGRYRGLNGGVGTHDVIPAIVRGSSKLPLLFASSYNWADGIKKNIAKYEMSFGAGTSAVLHTGGEVVPTQGAGGATYVAPPGVFYDNRRWTASTQSGNSCWYFLQSSDAYVAWSVSQGNAVNQLVTGNLYRLTTSLTGAALPATGITNYMEVARPADWSNNIANFRSAVVGRSGNACPQANGSGAVTYRMASGDTLTFTPTFAGGAGTATVAVSGSGSRAGTWTQTALNAEPRFFMDSGTYELKDFLLVSPTGKAVTFNTATGTLGGTAAHTARMSLGFTFGNLTVAPPSPVQVVVAVDTNVGGYLTATGGASAAYSPTTAMTTTASSTDNKWHVSNNYIGLSGLNAFTTHGATESSPQLTVTVSGLVPNTSYDLYGRFATASLQAVPEYWGPEMGPTAALLVRYSQAHSDFTLLRDWGNWEEREVDLGRVVTNGSGTTTLVLDDQTVNNNAVWSGLRLQPVGMTPAPLTKIITLTEDAHTLQAAPSSNYGTLDYLRIANITNSLAYSWIKLPVSGYTGKVIRARLRMRPKVVIDSAYVYRICSNSWAETTINWSNQPSASNCGYQTDRQSMTANSTQYFDLTDYINGLATYSIGIVTNDLDPNLDFYSTEYVTTSYRPELQIEYRP